MNRIEKLTTGPSQGKRACLRDSEYILFEILALRALNLPARLLSRCCPCWPNWLGYLGGGFHALNSRISYKIYHEALRHGLSSYKGLVDGFCNFVQNPLSALWLERNMKRDLFCNGDTIAT